MKYTTKLVLFIVVVLLIAACSKSPDRQASTNRVITPDEIRAAFGSAYCGDAAYAEVRAAELPAIYADFRKAIFEQGVTKWDERFDCNHFAAYMVARAQAKFYLDNFHSRTQAQTLAIGVVWYVASPGKAHAVVAAFTESGLIFIEPQTGQRVDVNPQSAYLKVF